jgi:hypothetical protein
MSNEKHSSEDTFVNPIDAVLNETQDDEISRPESVEEVGFDVKTDDLAHRPDSTSQEHSLDDTHETLTQACFDRDDLLAVAEAATKINSTS